MFFVNTLWLRKYEKKMIRAISIYRLKIVIYKERGTIGDFR